MSQYDDSHNPFSSASGRPDARSPWGESAPSPSPSADGLQLPGEVSSPWSNNGDQRPSPVARRRNQWRQQQQLTPDFGAPAPAPIPEVEPPRPVARNASLPAFKRSGPAPDRPVSGDRPGPAARGNPPPPGQAPPSGSPLQIHPHSFPGGSPGVIPLGGAAHSLQFQNTLPSRPAQGRSGRIEPSAAGLASPPSPLPPNVTALRPSDRRRMKPGPGPAPAQVTRSPAEAAASGVGLSATRRPSRLGKARRRLANPPLPLLYLIRLVILGVGVAAIAGTLLSVLNPANVASSQPGATPEAQALGDGVGVLAQGTDAGAITDLRLTSEITRLKGELEQLANLTPGLTPAAFAVDLDSGQYADLGGAETIAAASTIKVPILIAFLQQVDADTLALNQSLMLQEEYIAGGSGNMSSEAIGNEYTALEVATRMIVISDNTATNMMIAALGGIEALNQTFADWGLESTLLRNPLPDLEGTNVTSAKDLALIMALVDQGGLLTPRSRDRLFSIMQRTQNDSLIPSGVADRSLKANKTGDIGSMLGDVALIDVPNGKRYVLALLVQRPNNDGRASELIRRMTETVHAEMAQPVAPVGNPNAPPLSPAGEFETPAGEPSGGVENPENPAPVNLVPSGRPPARDEIPPG